MTKEKVFVIAGTNIQKNESAKRKNHEDRSLEDSNKSYWNGCHIVSTLLTCGITMSVSTLIPRHNSIIEPTSWFEMMFVVGFVMITEIAETIWSLAILMQKNSLFSISLFVKLFMVSFLTWISIYCFCYILWTTIIGYNHPMPLVGMACGLPAKIVQIVSLPLLLPASKFAQGEFKDKLKNFALYQLAWIPFGLWQNKVLSMIFRKLGNSNAQCVMAVLIPASKILTQRFLSKVLHRLVGIENETVNVLLTVSVNFSYGWFVATKLVDAEIATVFCTVVVEFLMQLIMACKIVRHAKVNSHELDYLKIDKKKSIRKLALAELCEGLLPLAYAICFTMAYFGPNAKLIGNVKFGDWQYKVVEDANGTFRVMFTLFAVDLVCLSINSGLIWVCCRVNVFNEICKILQKYWWIIALNLANKTASFSGNDVNLALDFTYDFNWITNNETFSTTSNSTNI